jgi:hypothetical protein
MGEGGMGRKSGPTIHPHLHKIAQFPNSAGHAIQLARILMMAAFIGQYYPGNFIIVLLWSSPNPDIDEGNYI